MNWNSRKTPSPVPLFPPLRHDCAVTSPSVRLSPYSAPLLGLLLLGAAAPVRAQSLDPRFFVNTPVGMNFVVAGYGYTWGNVSFDPSVPIKNAHVTAHGPLLGYARAFNFWGLSGKANIGNAFACIHGTGDVQGVAETRNVCGLSDLTGAVSVNFIGAPALSLREFAALPPGPPHGREPQHDRAHRTV